MPTNRDEIKAICAMPMTGTAKLVAIAIVTFKTLDTNELAAITGESARTVQKARATYLELKDEPREPEFAERGETRESGEPEFAKDAKDANYNSPLAPASHARIETPSGLLSTEVKKEDSSLSEVPSDQCAKPKKVAKAKRRFAYSAEFEAFWDRYPDKANNSKSRAFAMWRELGTAEQELAFAGLRILADYCRKNPTYRCLHATTYLNERRWESYKIVPVTVAPVRMAAPPISDEEIFLIANGRAYQ